MKKAILEIKKSVPKEIILLNQPLKNYSSFKIGGRAKIILVPRDLEDLIKILKICEDNGVEPFILGKGTNLLIDDEGYDGIIIQLKGWFEKITVRDESIRAGAGAPLNQVVTRAHEHNLEGMSDAFGIPGSVGGAIFMNASAYSFETRKVVSSVLVIVNGKISLFDNEQCQFGYRSSVFQKNNAIILQVEYKLKKCETKLDHKELVRSVMQKRFSSQPLEKPSAGSVFRKCGDIPVGKLIDDLGLKGYTIGGAQISEKHANFIVNIGGATSKDVLALIKLMKEKVKEKYNLHIENEIRYLSN